MSRLLLLASILAAQVVAAGGCSPPQEPPSRQLVELERLAFVPAVSCYLQPIGFPFNPKWNFGVARPIVMDLFEVTRRDVARLLEKSDWEEGVLLSKRVRSVDPAFFEEDRLDWPAFFSYADAVSLAELRGMRLPTVTEWIHVAIGRRDLKYPWGYDQSSVANTVDTGLAHPTSVGTFESGRSRPFGCYDLVGNVWEWVVGVVPGYEYDVEDPHFPLDDPLLATAMGGGFDSPRRATYEWDSLHLGYRFHASQHPRDSISSSIGARMCADADAYLWEKAPRWGKDDAARARVRAVGWRWAQDGPARSGLLTLLEALTKREGAPTQLSWLLEGVRLSQGVLGEAN